MLPDLWPGWQDHVLTAVNVLSLLNLLDEAMHPRTRIPFNNAVLAVVGWAAYGVVMLSLEFYGTVVTSAIATLAWVWIAQRKSVPSGQDVPLVAGLMRLTQQAERSFTGKRRD